MMTRRWYLLGSRLRSGRTGASAAVCRCVGSRGTHSSITVGSSTPRPQPVTAVLSGALLCRVDMG
jgi:hypothetical protein